VVVLPTNHDDDVKRILTHFGVPADAMIKISGTNKTFLPQAHAEYANNLLSAYLELGTPVSRRQVQALAAVTGDEKQKAELERLSQGDAYNEELLDKRASVIDVLEEFPACKLSFASYIDMLQPMKPRQYSIASSPLASAPGVVSILYDVLEGRSLFNSNHKFHGVASSYLAQLPVSGKVHAYIKSTATNFHLPTNPSTPIIMIAAGTGLAPMRGFIQERAAIAAAQKIHFGKAVLYFGCRDADKDYICHAELEEWEKLGVVELRPAFSRGNKEPKHVPDRIWNEREELKGLFKAGAKVFLCGSASKLAKSTNEVIEKIAAEAKGCNIADAKEWLQKQKFDRYVTDVFG
jgi:cytochrome P450 / NADPH-cytochrome P450 reductase